jgi:hypothetical protein
MFACAHAERAGHTGTNPSMPRRDGPVVLPQGIRAAALGADRHETFTKQTHHHH